MKKKFKETKVGGFLGRLVKSKGAKVVASVLKGGIADVTMPIFGVASGAFVGLKEGLKEVKRGNLADEVGGDGKPNYPRLIAMVLMVILLVLYLTGNISEDQVNFVFGLFE